MKKLDTHQASNRALVFFTNTSIRSFAFVPPPAPPAPNIHYQYGVEGRQDIGFAPITANSFRARGSAQVQVRQNEQAALGDDDYADDLEGTLMVMPMRPPLDAAEVSAVKKERRNSLGGNSVSPDDLPSPPYQDYGRVICAMRYSIFSLTARKANKIPSNTYRPTPQEIPVVPILLSAILADLAPDIRKLLKDPLFKGLENTLRTITPWFEVINDSTRVRLTPDAHQWGLEKVPSCSIPIPLYILKKAENQQKQAKHKEQMEKKTTEKVACLERQEAMKAERGKLLKEPHLQEQQQSQPDREQENNVNLESTHNIPNEAPVTRKVVMVHRNRGGNKINTVEHQIFERFCNNCNLTPAQLALVDFEHRGGTKKAIMSKDGRFCGIIDFSVPLITQNDIDNIPLQKAHMYLGGPFLPHLSIESRPPPPKIFPPSVKWPWVPELAELDKVYIEYSRIPPSEMAYALMEFVPTYFVELRMVLKSMPHAAMKAIFQQERWYDGGTRQMNAYTLCKRYPMIIDFRPSKGDHSSVRLNHEQTPGLKNHPRFGMADKMMMRFCLEREGSANPSGVVHTALARESRTNLSSEEVASLPTGDRRKVGFVQERIQDNKIFRILLKNFPRYPNSVDAARRHEFINLMQFINNFPPEDIEAINELPQDKLVRIIMRYTRIFQISALGEDPHLFTPYEKLLQMNSSLFNDESFVAESSVDEDVSDSAMRQFSENIFEKEVDVNDLDDMVEVVEESGTAKSSVIADDDSTVPPHMLVGRERTTAEADLCGSKDIELTEEEKHRVMNFNSSMAEEMIGIDDILLGEPNKELLSKCTDAKEDEVIGPSFDEMEKAIEREMTGVRGQVETPVNQEDNSHFITIASQFDTLHIRRVPPNIAPRALSDLDFSTTCNRSLLLRIAEMISPPPTTRRYDTEGMHSPSSYSTTHSTINPKLARVGLSLPVAPRTATASATLSWRWISLDKIYKALNTEEKRCLRRYKGLANFLRLHGKVFEVSKDSRYVISHDPSGEVTPFIATITFFDQEERVVLPEKFDTDPPTTNQSFYDEELRKNFEKVLGSAQVPTNRLQLQILDPRNPLLDSVALGQEIADFLPDHPVSLRQFNFRCPPLIRAALPSNIVKFITKSAHITLLRRGQKMYIVKSTLEVVGDHIESSDSVATLEETIAECKKYIDVRGMSPISVWLRLSFSGRNYVKSHFQNIAAFFMAFPKHFYIESLQNSHGFDKNTPLSGYRQTVHTIDNIALRRQMQDMALENGSGNEMKPDECDLSQKSPPKT